MIRDATSHHSNPTLSFPPIPIPYRRSRSAVTVSDVSIMTESPGAVSSARILRKYSLSCLSGTSTEVWPETITGLLTGGQLLMDRSILFSLLAEELDVSSDASPKHVSGPLMFSSRKTEGLSMLSGGVSIPRPDKKWG